MIKNKIILFCFLVLLFSCSKKELIETEITDETCLSDDEFNNEFIMQAQVFFENEVKNSVDTCTNKGNESSARKLIEKNLLWEQAYVKELSFGTGIVIPVKYETELYVPKGSSSVTLSQLTYVLIYLNHQGKMKAELVSTLPDEAYCSSDSSDLPFTGLVMVEDWHGNYIKGFWHNEGQIKNIKLKDSNSKVEVVNCFVTEYYNCISGGENWTCYLYDVDQVCYSGALGSGGEEYTPSGGGVSLDDDNPNTSNRRVLTLIEKNKLLNVKKDLLVGYCPNQFVINSVWSSLNFNIDPTLSEPAGYNARTNTISFRNSNAISEYNLIEEVFHAYQNTVYAGGILQYANKPGETNIEFEAKLYKDISVLYNGGPQTGSIGFPEFEMSKYKDLLWYIFDNGIKLSIMTQYSTCLNYFLQYSGYDGGVLDKLSTPEAFIKALSNCN